MTRTTLLLASAALAMPAAADAQVLSANDAAFDRLIVGMSPTRDPTPLPPTHVGGGNAAYFPDYSFAKGVAALIMDYGVFTSGPNVGLAARFICSGSLVGGNKVVTAAHCVNSRIDTTRAKPITTTYLHDGSLGDVRVPFNPGVTAIEAADFWINPGYTGQVIDHNDIAVLRLSTDAPAWASIYDMLLETGPSGLRGLEFNVYGYGGRSIVGGCGPLPGCASGGVTNGTTGYLRQGYNIYDYRMGDPIFSVVPGNGWQTVFPANPNLAYSYISDFDSGLAANDQACLVAQASNLAQAAGAVFCQTGVGALREVSVAGGDSGGPQFVGGRVASVTSYGLSFGTVPWGDCRAGLQSSCGEMNGFVPLYFHRDWLLSVVPEPGTWAMLIAGFGMVGAAVRRRRETAAA
jgi:hypothetical protein